MLALLGKMDIADGVFHIAKVVPLDGLFAQYALGFAVNRLDELLQPPHLPLGDPAGERINGENAGLDSLLLFELGVDDLQAFPVIYRLSEKRQPVSSVLFRSRSSLGGLKGVKPPEAFGERSEEFNCKDNPKVQVEK